MLAFAGPGFPTYIVPACAPCHGGAGCRDDDAKEDGELRAIYLLADRWGHGLGRALMDASLDSLRRGGFTAATLWVLDDELYDRIAGAARSSGLAAELNSSGWRKPCAEAYPAPALLARFHDYGVPITTASDGHELGHVSWRVADLVAMARSAGYSEVSAFRGRNRTPLPL